MQRQKILNLSFDIQRRQALKIIRDLRILALVRIMLFSLKSNLYNQRLLKIFYIFF